MITKIKSIIGLSYDICKKNPSEQVNVFYHAGMGLLNFEYSDDGIKFERRQISLNDDNINEQLDELVSYLNSKKNKETSVA